MIVLLDTSEALDVCAMELGAEVHQLVTPGTGFNRQKEHDWFCIDNFAFAGFRRDKFESLLARENEARHLCKWVAVPDVVGSARRTGELFKYWKYKLPGWPLAFVAQNGQEDRPIPWKHIQCLFIGGLDKKDGQGDWKLSIHAKECIRTAQGMGKWVHVGRVNTPGRFEMFEEMGVDSIDGTGLSRYTHMREAIWKRYNQKNLFTDIETGDSGKSARDQHGYLLTDLAPSADESIPLEIGQTFTAETAPAITAGNGNAAEGSGCTDQ